MVYTSQAKRDEFKRLARRYNELIGKEGNVYLNTENFEDGTGVRYRFRDHSCIGIKEALEYVTILLSGLQLAGQLGTVHVDNRSVKDADVTRAQRAMKTWHNSGYAVALMPVDGREHVYDKPCPACSEAQS